VQFRRPAPGPIVTCAAVATQPSVLFFKLLNPQYKPKEKKKIARVVVEDHPRAA